MELELVELELLLLELEVVVLVVIMRESQPTLEIYGPLHISCIDGLYSLPFIQKQSSVVCLILSLSLIVFYV